MAGWVEMSIEREPSFFAGGDFGGEEWAVIAEEQSDIVGMYSAAVRCVYVNGQAERLGYLGGLRVASNYRHRIRYLRQGYASIRDLAPASGTLPWWFTVVAADNVAARKLLEAGVRGLPTYHALGEYVTFALPTSRSQRRGLWRPAKAADIDTLVGFHNAHASRFNLAPSLDRALVRRIGLDLFYVLERDRVLQGVAALWDQRSFKQIVATRYRHPVGNLVPIYNVYAKLFQRIPLPFEGQALNHTFVAFLALGDDVRAESRSLLRDLLSYCRTPIASLGLHSAHPLNEAVRHFKPIRYPARVYAVTFEGEPPVCDRPIQPEAAYL
jgi:hypothetical protein